MRFRQLAFSAAAITTAAALVGGVSPARAATSTACTKGSTLGISKSARVFSIKKGTANRVYGCAKGSTKRTYLGRRGGEGIDPSVLAVNGPRVAYVRTGCSEAGCLQTVFVHDLKKRKGLSSAEAAPADAETKVTDIVLTSKGTVAWIGEVRADSTTATGRYVFAQAPSTPAVAIATGLNIVPGSLALAATRLYWLQGAAVSVLLP